MQPRLPLFAAALLGAAALLTLAPARAGDRVALFDGKSLDGWTVTCDTVVDQGEIFIRDGNGLVQLPGTFGDFVLELEWKALKPEKWDSGIYFRYDSVPAGKPWPPRYQVNLRQGDEGNVGGIPGAKSTGLTLPGEWNKLKLTVRGADLELELNGKPAWKASGLTGPAAGFIALQAEVPGGGQYRFRNVFVTKLH